MSSEHLFFISLWLLCCGDHCCAGTSLGVSVPLFPASQQDTGVVSSPFAEGRCRSRKTELKRSALGGGWSYRPLFPALWTAGTRLRVSPAAAINTWCLWRPGPDAAYEGIFQVILEQLALHDDSCNLQMLRDLPGVMEELCDGGTKKYTPNLPGRSIPLVLLRHPFFFFGPGLLSLFYPFQFLLPSFLNAWLCNLSNEEGVVNFFFWCVISTNLQS